MQIESRILTCVAAIFALCASTPAAAPSFNVIDYGARNDGPAPATPAFRTAIEAARTAGGGTVHVPAGKYVIGPIELVSNLVLDIDAGAVILFTASREGLTYTKGRLEGVELITPVPLIGGHDLDNVTIRGQGVITTDNSRMAQTRTAAGRDCRTNGLDSTSRGARIKEAGAGGGLRKSGAGTAAILHSRDEQQECARRRASHPRLLDVDDSPSLFGARGHSRSNYRNLPGGEYGRH
jgi:polygalacturonase